MGQKYTSQKINKYITISAPQIQNIFPSHYIVPHKISKSNNWHLPLIPNVSVQI